MRARICTVYGTDHRRRQYVRCSTYIGNAHFSDTRVTFIPAPLDDDIATAQERANAERQIKRALTSTLSEAVAMVAAKYVALGLSKSLTIEIDDPTWDA